MTGSKEIITLNNELKKARLKAGLTQQAMSDLLGIPLRTIESWDTNKRTPPGYVERLVIEKLNTLK